MAANHAGSSYYEPPLTSPPPAYTRKQGEELPAYHFPANVQPQREAGQPIYPTTPVATVGWAPFYRRRRRPLWGLSVFFVLLSIMFLIIWAVRWRNSSYYYG